MKNENGTGQIGIEVGVDFNGQASITNLKNELRKAMEELKDEKVEFKFSTGDVANELGRLKEQFRDTKETIDSSFSNINISSLEKMMGIIKQVSELDNKLQGNMFKGVNTGIEEAVASADKLNQATAETLQSFNKINEQSEIYGKNMGLISDSTRRIKSQTTQVEEGLNKVARTSEKYGESMERTVNTTVKATQQAKELYRTYESMELKIQEMRAEISRSTKNGASDKVIEGLKAEKECYEQILKDTKKIIKDNGLINESTEKRIQEQKNILKIKQETNKQIEKEVNLSKNLADRVKILNEDMKNAIQLRKRLMSGKYASGENKLIDEQTLSSLEKSISNRAKNITNKQGEIADSFKNKYNNYKDDVQALKREEQANKLIREQKAYEDEFNNSLKEANKLLEEKLRLTKKIDSDQANAGLYKGRIKDIDSRLSANIEGKDTAYLTAYGSLEEEYALNKAIYENQKNLKAMNKEQKSFSNEYIKNLKKIAKLQTEIDKSDSENVQKEAQNQINKLLEEQTSLYSKLDTDSKVRVEDLAKEIEAQREIVKIKLSEVKANNQVKQSEKEQSSYLNRYLQTLKEEISLREEMAESNTEENRLRIDSKINELLSERENLYSQMNEETKAISSVEEARISDETQALEKEKLYSDFLERQKTAYQEILALEEKRVMIETELNKMDTTNKFVSSRNIRNYQDVLSTLEAKKRFLSESGLYDSDMAKANEEALANSRATQEFIKSQAQLSDRFAITDERIAEYGAKLESLSAKYGYVITKTDEYKNALERLQLIGELKDVNARERYLTTMSDSLTEVEKKAQKSDEALTHLFNRWKEFAGYTMVNMATQGILGSFNEAWENIKKINDSYTELHKVYDPNVNGGWKASNWIPLANKMGQTYGYSTADTLDALYQAINYGFGNRFDAQEIAKSALMLSNTGRISEADASKYLISIMETYQMTHPNKMVDVYGHQESEMQSIIDQLSFGGMYFPITSGGIGQALQRGGSALATAGNSLQQSIELIIAGNEGRADPAVVGNSMKSIAGSFTNILMGKGKTAQKDFALLEKLTGGMDFFKKDGQMKSTFEIMSELSQLYASGKLSGNNLQLLADVIGGKTQLGVVTSIIKNLAGVQDRYNKQEASSEDGIAGSAEGEENKYINSIQGRLNKLKESVNDVWLQILQSGNIEKILDVGIRLVNIFDEAIKKFGIINTLAYTFVGIMSFKNKRFLADLGNGIITKLVKMINVVKKLLGKKPIKIKGEEESNSDIKEALNKTELAQNLGIEVGESYSNGIATAIRESEEIDVAIMEKLDKFKVESRGNETAVAEESEEVTSSVERLNNATTELNEQGSVNIEEYAQRTDESLTEVGTNLDEDIEKAQLLNRKLAETNAESNVTSSVERNIEEETENIGEHEVGNVVEREPRNIREHEVGGVSAIEHGAESEVGEIAEVGAEAGGLALDGLTGVLTGGIGLALFPAISYIMPKIVSYFSDLKTQMESYRKESEETYDSATQGAKKYGDQVEALQKFQSSADGKKLKALNEQYQNGELTTAQTKEYFDLLKKVAQIAPETVAFKGANGDPYINMANGVKGLIGDLQQLKKAQEEATISSQQVEKVWKTLNDERNKTFNTFDNQQNSKDSSQSESYLNGIIDENTSVENGIFGHFKLSNAEISDRLEKEMSDYNNIQLEKFQEQQSLKSTQAYMLKYYIVPKIDYSASTSYMDKATKDLMKSFMSSMDLSEMTQKQVDSIMSKTAGVMASASGKKMVSEITWNMDELQKEYATGKISYSKFVTDMGYEKNALVKELGFTPEEAQKATNAEFWKTLQTAQSTYVASMSKTAEEMGLNSKTLKSAFQNQFDMYNKWLQLRKDTSKLGQEKSYEALTQMFTASPEAGAILKKKLGFSMQTSLQDVLQVVGNSPQLKKAFGNAMVDIITGRPIPPQTAKLLSGEVTRVVDQTNKELATKNGIITLQTKVMPSKDVGKVGKQDGLMYASAVRLTAQQEGRVLNALGVKGIAVKDGTIYKDGVKQTAQQAGQILSATGIGEITVKDGAVYRKGIKMTAKQAGQVLQALGVQGIAIKDGQVYANGVKLTAKQMGQILNFINSGKTGRIDGVNYKEGAQATAIAKGYIQANIKQAEEAGNEAGRAYHQSLMSWIWSGIKSAGSELWNEVSSLAKNNYHSSPMGLFVIPHRIDINGSKKAIHNAFMQINSYGTSLWRNHFYGKRSTGGFATTSSKGGKGKGGKGGAIQPTAIMPTSFATIGDTVGSPDVSSTMMATGVSGEGLLGVPSVSTYSEAGSEAGYSYLSGFSQISNEILSEEATQYERLKNITDTYYDNDENNIKLSIDLNQRLKNTLTDIGNSIAHNQALQEETENGNTTIDLLQQELSLLNKKKEVNEALEESYQKQAQAMRESLEKSGFTFGADGSITNAVAKLQSLESWVNQMPDQVEQEKPKTTTKYTKEPYHYTKRTPGHYEKVPYHYYSWKERKEVYGYYNKYVRGELEDKTGYKYVKNSDTTETTQEVENKAKQNAKTTVQNLQNLVQAYNNMIHDTIPQTVSAIDQINQQVKTTYDNMLSTANSVESQITQIIQKQISERKQAIQNEANAQVKALNNVLTNMENKHNQEQYQTGLNNQYQQLQKIQEEINNAELDHSLNGQARLKELKEELANQQKSINQTISDHEYQEAQNKIQNQIKTIQNNSQQAQDDIDKTWTKQKIMQTVHEAMLTGKFRDVEGNIVSVKKVWVEFANEFDDGLGVMGNKIKDDFIDKLQQAQKIMENISEINSQLGYYNTSSATPKWVVPQQDSSFIAMPPMRFNNGVIHRDISSPQVAFNAPLVNVNGNVENTEDLHKFTKDIETRVTNHIVKNLRNKGAL